MTFYLDMVPNLAGRGNHEMAIEADTPAEAILAARELPDVLIITDVRNWSKPGRVPFVSIAA